MTKTNTQREDYMTNIQRFRQRRLANEISQLAVATKANLERSRVSYFEGGYLTPTAEELERLEAALDQLVAAKAAIAEAAAKAGWPSRVACL
jgi:transcriptional regulator with XRE-family HTH domain